MRIVVDSNVFLSGLLGSSVCDRIISLYAEGAFQLAISSVLLEELTSVANRSKFTKYINKEEGAHLVKLIETKAIKVEPTARINACRDIKDNMVLEAAIAAKAKYIVTGDKALLTLSPFKGIGILTPAQFLKLLKK